MRPSTGPSPPAVWSRCVLPIPLCKARRAGEPPVPRGRATAHLCRPWRLSSRVGAQTRATALRAMTLGRKRASAVLLLRENAPHCMSRRPGGPGTGVCKDIQSWGTAAGQGDLALWPRRRRRVSPVPDISSQGGRGPGTGRGHCLRLPTLSKEPGG